MPPVTVTVTPTLVPYTTASRPGDFVKDSTFVTETTVGVRLIPKDCPVPKLTSPPVPTFTITFAGASVDVVIRDEI